MLFTGCAYNTKIDVKEDGSYVMNMEQLDDDADSPNIAIYKENKKLYNQSMKKIKSLIDYSNITKDTFLIKFTDSTLFRKVAFSKGFEFDEDFGCVNMTENLLTVTMPEEVKVSNGSVSGNTVVFDLTKNKGTYYASCKGDYKYDNVAPSIKGVKDESFYKKEVTITCTDTDLDVLLLNGKRITSGYKVKDNGVYFLRAIDKYGNSTYVNFFIHNDVKAPTIVYDSNLFWMKYDRIAVDEMNRIKNNIIKLKEKEKSTYLFISDFEYLTKKVKADIWSKLPISKVSSKSRCITLGKSNALELEEPISSLKSVKINGKNIKVVNGRVIYKVKKGKTYKVVAKDTSGNEISKTIKVK